MEFSSPLVFELTSKMVEEHDNHQHKQNGCIELKKVMKKDDDVAVAQRSIGVTTKVVCCHNIKPHCKRVKFYSLNITILMNAMLRKINAHYFYFQKNYYHLLTLL
jgi:hypothetical protein